MDLCELHMPSCIQLCFAQLAPKRHDRSEIVCILDIFGIHLQNIRYAFDFMASCIVPLTPSNGVAAALIQIRLSSS